MEPIGVSVIMINKVSHSRIQQNAFWSARQFVLKLQQVRFNLAATAWLGTWRVAFELKPI